MPLYLLRFAQSAQNDLRRILRQSRQDFGEAASLRYSSLLEQTTRDLSHDPHRPGSRHHPELGPGLFTYHLRFSKSQEPANRVTSPRHLFLYQVQGNRVLVLRVLHDRNDLRRHIN